MVKENRRMKNRVTSSDLGLPQAAPLKPASGHGDVELASLITLGRELGYLTFDQVNAYLPDEAVDPEKIDTLLVALEERGIELVDTPPEPRAGSASQVFVAAAPAPQPRRDEATTTPPSNAANDPIRMYLAQMAEIPLLSRREEISLAKRIEVTRKRFRRAILGCAYSLQATVDTLRRADPGANAAQPGDAGPLDE
jgi:RNA polymerase primary sigma factor